MVASSVAIVPGATALTRMPWSASAFRGHQIEAAVDDRHAGDFAFDRDLAANFAELVEFQDTVLEALAQEQEVAVVGEPGAGLVQARDQLGLEAVTDDDARDRAVVFDFVADHHAQLVAHHGHAVGRARRGPFLVD